jgi:hypothetical protein
MNVFCHRDCKHKSYCHLDADKTQECKFAIPDGLIFGRTFDEINKIQQKKLNGN